MVSLSQAIPTTGYMDGSGTGGSDGRPQLPSVITPPDHSVEVPTVQPPVTEPLPDEPVTEPVEPSTDEPFTVPSEPSAEEPPTEPSTQEVDPYVSSTQTEIVTTTAAFSEETESILTE